MSEDEKNAYRLLLYHAMLDIRNLCQPLGPQSRNPLEWRRQYIRSRLAGALADWLHNLAFYAGRDFKGFDQEQFWREYERLCGRFSPREPDGQHYRKSFEFDKDNFRKDSA